MKILILSLFVPTFAFASASFSVEVSCVNIDGVPMTGDMASKCCKDGSNIGTDECMTGLGSLKGEAINTIAQSLQISASALNIANALSGVPTDLAAQMDTLDGSDVKPKAEGFASNAGGGLSGAGAMNLGSDLTGSGTGDGAKEGASGGAGAQSAGAGSGGLGLGNADASTGAAKSGLNGDLLASKDAMIGGYSQGGGGPGRGSGGGSDTSVGTDGFSSQKFKDGKADELAGKGQDGDEDGTGIANDPADYFKRIDKSANIFKIVSNRYSRKKSLWNPANPVQAGIVPVIKR